MDLKEDTDSKGLSKVKGFWVQTNSIEKWRTWRNFEFRDESPLKAKAKTLKNMLEQRKILKSREKDQAKMGQQK